MEEAELLEEFVDWLKDCGEDVFYVFDDTEVVIEEYLKIKNQ